LCRGYYAPDNIESIFEEIFKFISDAAVLSSINIGILRLKGNGRNRRCLFAVCQIPQYRI
jgi:hypothetical protein